MKYYTKRMYKLVAKIFAFLINTIGMILSIIGAFASDEFQASQTFIAVLLTVAELFLILSTIYSVCTIVKSFYNKVSIEQKETELMQHRYANERIFENNKATITYYKDFADKLNVMIAKYEKKLSDVQNLKALTDATSPRPEEMVQRIAQIERNNYTTLESELLELYNRFIINMINCLQESIEEYLRTKGCDRHVSIALKQLEEPTKYSKINDKKSNIYTAFRDKKTYSSKTRNETWQKTFCISKNSDFLISIEKDFYIFNHVTKRLSEDGLYLNENTNFYENYNSGVTCTIYSCVGNERVLYGFLACDSLLDEKEKSANNKGIYDYNVANILMSTAHIIALFLGDFLQQWDKYVIQGNPNPDTPIVESPSKANRTLCKVMIERVNTTRYVG